jgi:hypothetical protein
MDQSNRQQLLTLSKRSKTLLHERFICLLNSIRKHITVFRKSCHLRQLYVTHEKIYKYNNIFRHPAALICSLLHFLLYVTKIHSNSL